MPAFNAEETLERSVSSVLKQTRTDWELLIVDDCSTDRTRATIQSFANSDNRIKPIFLTKNGGAGVARNAALDVAHGQYAAFLDADDEWHHLKLEKQVTWMEENDIAFSCTAYDRMKNGETVKTTKVPTKASRKELLKNNTVGALTAVFDRSLFPDLRMPTIRRRQDYAFWLELLEKIEYVWGIDQALAKYHLGNGSLSSNKFLAARDQWRFYGDVLEMSFSEKLWYFCHYAVNASKRNF